MISDRPTLYILCGLPYSGKTTLAQQISPKFQAQIVSLDQIKDEYGYKDTPDEEVSQDSWQAIFLEQQHRISQLLGKRQNVISDSTNTTHFMRQELYNLAQANQSDTALIYLNVPIEVIEQRYAEKPRQLGRQISPQFLSQAIASLEAPTPPENPITYWQKSLDDLVREIISAPL